MTAPVVATDPRLGAIAGWDVPRVQRAVAVLTEVSEHLVGWRARMEGLGRVLESGSCWDGAAARSAALTVEQLETAAWAVDDALRRSLDAYLRMAAEAVVAQECAEAALAGAAVAEGAIGWGGRTPARWQAAERSALEHAEATAAAADEAGADLAGLGVSESGGPADFSDLLEHLAPVAAPALPSTGDPREVAGWWAALSPAAQEAAIATMPAAVGGLDGVPAWARDRANRILLSRALADPALDDAEAATARAVARRIAAEEASGRQVQLHLLDLTGDRVALAIGDLDTAEAVALVVPGVFNTAADDLPGLTGDAIDLADATRAADRGSTVAAVVWLGYRTPSNLAQAAFRTNAERGGRALARALDGLAAARRAVATPAPRTTVVAHSYGTYVVDEAADEPGVLAADAVVLLGSPGMEDDAASLEVPEVFDAAAPADPITWATAFGEQKTWEESYGSTGLPTDLLQGHSGYFDPDRPTLAAMGEVVAGTRSAD